MDPGWVKTRMGGDGAILEPHESISGMLDTIHKAQKNGETAKYYTVSVLSFVSICRGTDMALAQRKRDPVVSLAWQVQATSFVRAGSRVEELAMDRWARDAKMLHLTVDHQQVRSDIPTHQLIHASFFT